MEVENEIWKDISGYPGYQVSSLGRIKSLNYNHTGKEEILKPNKSRGYFKVRLYKKGKNKNMYIHRLVAQAFVQNYSLLNTDVNHKNEDKTDNRSDNLEFCTREYNCNFGTRNKRISKAHTGVYNNIKKSKPVMCIETGIIYQSTKEVQRKLGFAQSNICNCCIGKRKSCGGYHWRYVE